MSAPVSNDVVIAVRGVEVGFGPLTVLDGVDLDVFRGEVLGFVGGSGAGKSVLLRTIIGLIPKRRGHVEVLGHDMDSADARERQAVERRWGVLFQQGALFSSLTVRQNLQFPMREYLRVSERLMDEIAVAKLAMVGLSADVCERYPSQLSGGMTKRVALARALSLDPEIVFLDEPTSGLDPISAGEFDELIRTLQRTLGLTVFMVTHDLDSLSTVCDRIAVLADRKIIAAGPMPSMLASEHPWLRAYFHGKRGRAARHEPEDLAEPMETRANYVLIGLFTLAALFGAAGFVYWFQHGGAAKERSAYRVVFEGTVSGLRTGGAVNFNGIRVGEVTGLDIDPDQPTEVIATISIDQATPIRSDTQIGLEYQGLTGIAALSLRGGSPQQPILSAAKGEPTPTLRADPRMSQDLFQASRDLLTKLDKLVADNEGALATSLKNIQSVTDTLARNADSFDRSMRNIETVTGTFARNAEGIDRSLRNVETVTDTFARNSEKFDRIIAGLDNLAGGPEGKGDIQQAARAIRDLAENLDKRAADLVAGVNGFTSVGKRELSALTGDAKRTLAELDRAIRNFDRNPSRLIFGGGNTVPEYNGRR